MNNHYGKIIEEFYVIQTGKNKYFTRFYSTFDYEKGKKHFNIIDEAGLYYARQFLRKEDAEKIVKRINNIDSTKNPVIKTAFIGLKN